MNNVFKFIIQRTDLQHSINSEKYFQLRAKFVENVKIFKMRDNNNESFF